MYTCTCIYAYIWCSYIYMCVCVCVCECVNISIALVRYVHGYVYNWFIYHNIWSIFVDQRCLSGILALRINAKSKKYGNCNLVSIEISTFMSRVLIALDIVSHFWLALRNTLAFFVTELITAVKKFYDAGPIWDEHKEQWLYRF